MSYFQPNQRLMKIRWTIAALIGMRAAWPAPAGQTSAEFGRHLRIAMARARRMPAGRLSKRLLEVIASGAGGEGHDHASARQRLHPNRCD
jgi:hypothetical protein